MVNNKCRTVNMKFHEMELDDRILKAIAKVGWEEPTLIQEKAIPLLLEGKDVLMRARTGSGKTAAFAIPAIQRVLSSKEVSKSQEIKVLVLAPSKELCHQIWSVIKELTSKCSTDVQCLDLAASIEVAAQKPLLVEKPDIVVSTPSKALLHLKMGNMNLKQSMDLLIVDEADLMLSFGYEDEVKEITLLMPQIYQAVLASATLSEDVKNLKSLILHNPVVLKLEEPDLPPISQLDHYQLMAEEIDKATILYSLLKLRLIRGKTIVFVNTVDKCYKIKLYLEQFAIKSCVLNSELPATVRCHSVGQFNAGIYDIIIASDEQSLEEPTRIKAVVKEKPTKRRKDRESGVSRGIDFQFVSNVINFDFPLDVHSYVHRAGRTARGNNHGSVLSFISLKEKALLDKVDAHLKQIHGEDSDTFKTYQFKLDEVESFKYRAQDAWRAATRIAVREARLKEIKTELINCEKLKSYFEQNPSDLQVLRHDKTLRTVRLQAHLADVPDYIVPETLKNTALATDASSVVSNRKKNKRKFEHHQGNSKNNKRYQSAASNPLKTFA